MGGTVATAWNLQNDDETVVATLDALTVDITVAAEGGDEIDVLLQIEDNVAEAVTENVGLTVWLTDLEPGDSPLSGTVPSTGVALAASAKGVIVIETVADLYFECVTDENGELEFTIGEAGVDTWYMQVKLPGGEVVTSAAITFA